MVKASAVLLVTGAFGSKGFGRSRHVKTSDSNTGFLVRSYSDPLLARCQPLDGGQGLLAVPAQRKARREYENRVSALTP
ncbi:hypothetical protein [Streptomyces sp. NPDC002559]